VGQKILAPYYSQRAVFVSLRALFLSVEAYVYADDLIFLMAESVECLRDKIVKWKSGWKERFEDEYRKNEGNVQL